MKKISIALIIVFYVNILLNSVNAFTTEVPPKPTITQPQNWETISKNQSTFRITWSKVPSATWYYYTIRKNDDGSNIYPQGNNGTSGTYVDLDTKNLEYGTMYALYVRAANSNGAGDYSKIFFTVENPYIAPPKITQPRNLETIRKSHNTFRIAWEAVPNANLYYYSIRKDGHGSTIYPEGNTGTSRTYVDLDTSNLEYGTNYVLYVRAASSDFGTSDHSEIKFSVEMPPATPAPATPAPATPAPATPAPAPATPAPATPAPATPAPATPAPATPAPATPAPATPTPQQVVPPIEEKPSLIPSNFEIYNDEINDLFIVERFKNTPFRGKISANKKFILTVGVIDPNGIYHDEVYHIPSNNEHDLESEIHINTNNKIFSEEGKYTLIWFAIPENEEGREIKRTSLIVGSPIKLSGIHASYNLTVGEIINLSGEIENMVGNIEEVSLSVKNYYGDRGYGQYNHYKLPNVNNSILDMNFLILDANEEPINKVGSYKFNLWVSGEGIKNQIISTFEVNVRDVQIMASNTMRPGSWDRKKDTYSFSNFLYFSLYGSEVLQDINWSLSDTNIATIKNIDNPKGAVKIENNNHTLKDQLVTLSAKHKGKSYSINLNLEPKIASEEIKVELNGIQLKFDQPPIIKQGRTLVPFRAIFEELGAKVEWDAENRSAIGYKYNTKIELPIDSKKAMVNNREVILDVPATIINGRTLVPVRFVSEEFGLKVGWDKTTRTVIIDDYELIISELEIINNSKIVQTLRGSGGDYTKNEYNGNYYLCYKNKEIVKDEQLIEKIYAKHYFTGLYNSDFEKVKKAFNEADYLATESIKIANSFDLSNTIANWANEIGSISAGLLVDAYARKVKGAPKLEGKDLILYISDKSMDMTRDSLLKIHKESISDKEFMKKNLRAMQKNISQMNKEIERLNFDKSSRSIVDLMYRVEFLELSFIKFNADYNFLYLDEIMKSKLRISIENFSQYLQSVGKSVVESGAGLTSNDEIIIPIKRQFEIYDIMKVLNENKEIYAHNSEIEKIMFINGIFSRNVNEAVSFIGLYDL
ncbi:stalk domain-containing protein [Herbivorax sp. ANBcel31]|uniref:stalk domain-containing protein n=1 Tax=Herbivorax sp. ANBcel31 TaxID=3069754 RepID=UPI0027B2773B|nr:stalk domain-containing protein [Herbivorax sp. ANBcel31]MDQ2085086.1 stalk domain-containing protein [Herbivorax sp. ANBcel31]